MPKSRAEDAGRKAPVLWDCCAVDRLPHIYPPPPRYSRTPGSPTSAPRTPLASASRYTLTPTVPTPDSSRLGLRCCPLPGDAPCSLPPRPSDRDNRTAHRLGPLLPGPPKLPPSQMPPNSRTPQGPFSLLQTGASSTASPASPSTTDHGLPHCPLLRSPLTQDSVLPTPRPLGPGPGPPARQYPLGSPGLGPHPRLVCSEDSPFRTHTPASAAARCRGRGRGEGVALGARGAAAAAARDRVSSASAGRLGGERGSGHVSLHEAPQHLPVRQERRGCHQVSGGTGRLGRGGGAG